MLTHKFPTNAMITFTRWILKPVLLGPTVNEQWT